MKTIRLALLTVLVTISCIAYAGTDDTTRVLYIGNSFTYTADVPGLVKGFADAAKFPLKFKMHAPGGISVGDTDQGTFAHMMNPDVFALIRSDNWDFVSLQDNQGRFVLGDGKFPNPKAYKVIEGHIKIKDSVKHYHPCARMLWFAGWAFKNGYPGISPTGKGLIENIYENYVYLKDTAGEIIAPIGIAWARSIDSLPGVDLWSPDEAHQSLSGSYLTAAVIFTSIYRVNTEAVSFTGGLDTFTARKLRQIAYRVVMDSVAATDLDKYMPGLVISGTDLIATAGYTSYKWYRNGLLVSTGASNVFTMPGSGCYYVVASDIGMCTERSPELCPWPTSLPDPVRDATALRIYPSPANEYITVELPAFATGEKNLVVTDVNGRVVRKAVFTANTLNLPLYDIQPGLYFMSVEVGGRMFHRRFSKTN